MTAEDRQWLRTQMTPLRNAIMAEDQTQARKIIHRLISEAAEPKAMRIMLRTTIDRVIRMWAQDNT